MTAIGLTHILVYTSLLHFVCSLTYKGRENTLFVLPLWCWYPARLLHSSEFISQKTVASQYFSIKPRHVHTDHNLLYTHAIVIQRTLDNFAFCLHRRRQERERIGLCGVPEVWGKVQEEEHPQELVICSAVKSHSCNNVAYLFIVLLNCTRECLQCFDTVGWASGRTSGLWKNTWVVGCWRGYLSGTGCRLAYGPADATLTHCLLLQWNPDCFLQFWYQLTRVVLEKGH